MTGATATERRYALFWLGALAVFILLLYLFNGILLPFVAGAAIAYFLEEPAVDRLIAWRLPRPLAAAVVLILFLTMLLVILLLLVPLLQLQAAEMIHQAPVVAEFFRRRALQLMEAAQQQLGPEDLARLRDMAGGWAASALGWGGQIIEGVLTRAGAIASLLSLLFVTPIVAFFLLRDWHRLVVHIDASLPRRHAETIREQARLVDRTLAGFVHGQVLVCLVLAVYYATALVVAGVNFAVIIGILIGILSFIPYLGVAIGLVLALGTTLAQFGSLTMLAVVAGIFAVGHATESNFLSPKLVGERVNLHPVWVIFALLAFGTLFGFVGVLIALPAAAVIGVLVRFALHGYLESPLYDPDAHRPRSRDEEG